MLIGYARVSTLEQNLNLAAFPAETRAMLPCEKGAFPPETPRPPPAVSGGNARERSQPSPVDAVIR